MAARLDRRGPDRRFLQPDNVRAMCLDRIGDGPCAGIEVRELDRSVDDSNGSQEPREGLVRSVRASSLSHIPVLSDIRSS